MGKVEENLKKNLPPVPVLREMIPFIYRGVVDKSLARPGRKQANVSVRIA